MAVAFQGGLAYSKDKAGEETFQVTMAEPNGEALRWTQGNGAGEFDYHFPSDVRDMAVTFTFTDKHTATIFKMLFGD